MASLTGNLVAETYKALLKTIDNDILTASEKQITDGLGGGSNVFIDSQGFLRANKYKVTNGLATQFLKADGSLDSNAYLTSITGAQVITALGFTPVTNQRTLTINGVGYNLSADRSWTVEGTAAVWGNITGTLSNQTDLQNALNAKYNVPTGTISQYIRGDGSIANFPAVTGFVPYTGATANVDLGEYALSAEYLAIDTDTTHVTDVGEIVWNAIDGTFDMGLLNGVVLQAGQELHFYGKASGAIGNGQAVMFAGVEGDHLLMSLADAATINANPQYFIGIATQDFANNDFGYVTVLGKVRGLNTTSYSLGDVLYYNSTSATDGSLTTTMPVAPNAKIEVAAVVRVHATQGILMVRPHIMPKLNQVQDVYIADPANNHGLFYDLANGYWRNTSIQTVLGYTPQAQLSGTGFVKASGTTISYDNSTYLTTADAAATYLALIGGTLSGNLTISSANPKLLLTDTDNNPDYSIQNYNGTFKISDETNSADRFLIYSTGIGYYNGDFKANKLYVEGGLSTQFIKGDGTLDSNTYLTAASLDGYLAKSGGTMTGDLNFYTLKTTRVGGNAYIRGSWQGTYWGIGAAATGHTIIIDQVDFSTGAYESITDVNLMLGTRTVVHSGNVATYALPISGGTVTGSITATSFIKSGGTSSQFLMADGSVTTLSSPVTGSGSAGYIPKWTTAANIGSSNIYDDGTSIGIAYSTPNKGGYGRTLTGAAFGSASFGFEAVGGTTTNGGLVGGLSFILSQNDSSRIVGSAIQSNLVGTTATNYGADLRFYAKADAGVIGEVARMTSAGLRVYGTIIKDGGTSSQYLMADGSVSTFSGVTGSGTTNYLPKWTSSSALGNSVIFDNGNIGIRTTSTYSPLTVQGFGIGWGENATFYSSSSGYTTLAFWLQGATDYTGTWVISKQSRTVEASVEYFQIAKNGLTGSALHRADALQSWDINGNSYFGYKVGIGTMTPSASKLSLGMGVGVKFLIYDNPTSGVYSGLGQDMAAGDSIDLFAHGLSGLGFITFGQLATNKTTYTEWARFRTNGWFGIGTTSPDARLHVQSPTVSYGQIRFLNSSADGEATIHIGRSGQTLEQRWTFGQGPAGIGDNFGFYTLGSNKFTLSTSGDGYFLGGGTFNNTVVINKNNGYLLLNRTATTNYLGVGYRTSNVAKWFVGLRENSTDNYIIYNETTGLDALGFNVSNGIATFSGAYGTAAGVNVSGTTYGVFGAIRGSSAYSAGVNYISVGAQKWFAGIYENSDDFGFYSTATNNFPFVIKQSSGNVGIGTTNPSYKLSVANYLQVGAQGGNDIVLVGGGSGVGAFIQLRFADGSVNTSLTGNNNSYINAITGNLGVGTTSPSSRLSLGTGVGAKFMVYDNGSSVYTGLGQDLAAGNSTDLFCHGLSNLGFLTFGKLGTDKTTYTEWMRINPSGNVGIGNSGLAALGRTLTVEGTIISQTGAGGGNYNENMRANRAGNGYSAIAMGGAYGTTSGTGTGVWTLVATPAGVNYNFEFDYAGATKVAFSTGGNITATAFFESSDIRLKTLIESNPIIDGIEKLEAKLYEKEGKIEIGYFAQDAELIMPYAVQKNHDGFLNLSYREVHTAKIARLEQRVAELEKQLNLN